MTAQELHDHLLSKADAVFANALLNSQVEGDYPCFVIKKDSLSEVMTFLKENAECSFGFLTTLCAMHFPEQEEKEFGMVYHLHNLPINWRIRIKCFFPKSDLKVASLVSIWPTANWMERQEYDFFGIQFQGHPNLKRILNMDEMNYFPMRKEYGLEDASRDDKEDKYFGR